MTTKIPTCFSPRLASWIPVVIRCYAETN